MLLDGAGFLEDALIPGWFMLRDVAEPVRLVGELRQPDPAFVAASAPPTVVLKKGPNLSANAAASTAFDQAAAIVESLFDDPVTIVVDAEIAALEEGILGQSDLVEFSLDYDDLRSRIVADADPATEAIVSRLPTRSQFNPTFPDSSFSFSGLLRMTRANLLAIGVASADLSGGADSQYDPTVKRDMSITFNSRYSFDYTRSDGISSSATDFVAVAVHEMLHGLGFLSTIDTVDLLLDDSSYSRSVEPTSLDLFRLLPGQGSADFTMASRVLAPGSFVPHQVVYDGGVHDFRAAGYVGITVGDIPVATGESHGDGRQGSHFKDNDEFTNKLNIGIMDPVMFSKDPAMPSGGVQIEVQSPDVRMLGLIGWDVAEIPQTTLFQTDFPAA